MDDHYIGTIAPQNLYVRSLYDYQADDAGSLSFRQGDVIQVLNQLDNGWWDGWLHGVRGWFPSNYCEPITQNDLQTLGQEGQSDDEDYDLDEESDGDYEVYLDEGYRDNANDVVDGASGARRTSEQEGLWIPQASADGAVYYFNTVTGNTRREPIYDRETSGAVGRRLPPELMIGGLKDAEYDENASEITTLMGSSTSLPRRNHYDLSNGVSPSTSLESLTLAESHAGSSMNLSLLQQATTPRPPAPTSFLGTSNWSKSPPVSQRLFNGTNGVPLTWPRILEEFKASVERYRRSITGDDRGDFVRRVEDISDHLRLILAAGSGTTDDHFGNPSAIMSNRFLYPHYREIMAKFPKLVLSSHAAARDFATPELRQKCQQEAEEMLNAVYGYVEVARQQQGEDIPRLFPGFVDNQHVGGAWRNNNRLSIQSASDISGGRQSDEVSVLDPSAPLDKTLLNTLEDLRHQMGSGIRSLQEQLNFSDNMIDVARHQTLSDDIATACGKVLSLSRPWLATIESVDLSSMKSSTAAEKDLAEFASKKQGVYSLIGDLVLTCQAIALPLADEWTTNGAPPLQERLADVKSVVERLDKCAFEIAEPLRQLATIASIGSPNKNRRSTRMSGTGRNAQGTALTSISQAASKSGEKSHLGSTSPGSSNGHPGSRPQSRPQSKRESQELPKFLQLEYEADVMYDTKSPTQTIRGGTLVGLVEQLTRHDKYDFVFNNTFLLTYQSFTTANQLFDLLVARWNVQPMPGLTKDELAVWVERKQTPIHFRIVNVLKSWLDTYWMEGTDKDSVETIQRIHSFVKTTVQNSIGEKGSKPLLVVVEQRMRGEEVNSRKLVANSNVEAPTPILPRSLNKKNPKIVDIDPLELARQLTIMESNLYRKIRPPECLNRTVKKKLKDPDTEEQATNIKALILHSNRVTNWVAFMILLQDKLRERVNMIKYFVTVADKCLYMGNFSTLTSIISAFGATPIHRLQRTWAQVGRTTTAQLEKMRTLMGTAKNFLEYREALHRANPPCIPFFGVYLTDLTFIEDGIPSLIKNTDLINFAKRAKTAEVIREIQTYQNVAYPFIPVAELHDIIIPVILSAPDISEQTQYDRSLKLEPREREDEKIARLLSESGFL